ncbi:MAG TPA: helix-hairpin-helix domain-containing protein [Verrucomicrobiae bacterium]|nr:helix-hairpin-helix domain-containing protein [Verrucomicrobiae bacterium]
MKPSEYLSRMLFEFSYWHAIKNHPFKPQAYELASESVAGLGDDIRKKWKKGGLKALDGIPGIGQKIAAKIDEYFRTGHVKEYDALKRKFPVDIWGLSRIEGLGPKHIGQLWRELHVATVEDLEFAIEQHKLAKLKGWGPASEEKLAKGIELLRSSTGRHPLGEIEPVAKKILARLKKVKGVKRVAVAGSIRRKKKDVGDIDLIATSADPKSVMEYFVSMPEVEAVHVVGKTLSSVRLNIGIDCDLRVVPDKVFGSTLQYFTGDRRHNILLRERAIKQGYKLNEYGLFKNGKLVPVPNEDDIYRILGLKMFPPEQRLGHEEFVAR